MGTKKTKAKNILKELVSKDLPKYIKFKPNQKIKSEEELLYSFWSKVYIKGEHDCWLWQGARKNNKTVSGSFTIQGINFVTSRLVYLLCVEDPGDEVVRNTCENALCCNPNHLFLLPQKYCVVDGCSSAVNSLGYCQKHYQQYKNHGKTLEVSKHDFNKIVYKKDYCELILTDKTYNEVGRAKIDIEDLKTAKLASRWTLTSQGYVRNKELGLLHRLIMNAEDNEEIDHVKTGFKYRSDNRKQNLRKATRSENQFNTSIKSNNTSGYKGVSYNKKSKKWYAEIQCDKNRLHLGSFDTAKEASLAYKSKARELHKEFYNEV